MISCVVAVFSPIVDNLIELPYLNEPEILEALCQRYTQQLIYTYTGDDDDRMNMMMMMVVMMMMTMMMNMMMMMMVMMMVMMMMMMMMMVVMMLDDDDDDYNNLSHLYRQYPHRHQSAE